MKRISILSEILYGFLLICTLFLFTTCREKTPVEPTQISERILAENEIWNDTLIPMKVYSYDGNLLTGIVEVDGMAKTVIQYSGNAISSFRKYYKMNGVWYLQSM
jgi:hypothetical protein